MPTTMTRDEGRLLGTSRRGVGLLLFLALANGLFLYLVPSQAVHHYAWSIKPRPSAAFIGAGFVAGTVATALGAFVTHRWRSLSMLAPALWVLSVTLFTATMLHADKFKFGYPPTWAWVAVYGLVPLAIPFIYVRQQRRAGQPPPRDPALRGVRAASLVLGGAIAIGSLALFIEPTRAGRHWPWLLTPLLAQVVAAWYGMVATALIACGLTLRARSEALIPFATLATWSVVVLALAPLYASDVRHSGTPFFIWLAVMAALLVLSLVAVARAAPAVRADPLTL